jgi:hypothetical protein
MYIVIDGEIQYVFEQRENRVRVGRNTWYTLFADADAAEVAARKHLEDMADNDRKEFLALFGENNIMDAFFQGRTLTDFLDEVSDADNEFGGGSPAIDIVDLQDYIGELDTELDEEIAHDYTEGWDELCNALRFVPTIAYGG